jgi:putative phage-type endonuclease
VIQYPAAELVCPASDPGWLAHRDTGLGASDMPTVLGVGYGTLLRLWAKKTGQLPGEPANHAQRIGHLLENYLAEILSDHHRRPLIQTPATSCLYRSPLIPWQMATPDGAFSLDELIECKTINSREANRLGLGTPGTDEVPPAWIVQAQQQMAVTGAQCVYFGVLVDNVDFLHFHVCRSERLQHLLVKQGGAFWRLVQSRTEPPPDFGHAETAELLKRLHPLEPGQVVTLDDFACGQQSIVDDCNEQIAKLEKIKDHAKNVLRACLGNAEYGVLPGTGKALRRRTVTRKPTEATTFETITKVNWKEE